MLGLIGDGLWDIYNNQHMGMCGELCADKYQLTREDQDNYAIRSYERAAKAWEMVLPYSCIVSILRLIFTRVYSMPRCLRFHWQARKGLTQLWCLATRSSPT